MFICFHTANEEVVISVMNVLFVKARNKLAYLFDEVGARNK